MQRCVKFIQSPAFRRPFAAFAERHALQEHFKCRKCRVRLSEFQNPDPAFLELAGKLGSQRGLRQNARGAIGNRHLTSLSRYFLCIAFLREWMFGHCPSIPSSRPFLGGLHAAEGSPRARRPGKLRQVLLRLCLSNPGFYSPLAQPGSYHKGVSQTCFFSHQATLTRNWRRFNTKVPRIHPVARLSPSFRGHACFRGKTCSSRALQVSQVPCRAFGISEPGPRVLRACRQISQSTWLAAESDEMTCCQPDDYWE